MTNVKLYTVKEAAKVIGVSTNTLYKYLDDGKIKAARGTALQGRFRIPESALEEFLGVSLDVPVTPNSDIRLPIPDPIPPTPDRRPHLPLRLARFLLLIALLALVVDLFISREVSLLTQATRLFFLLIMLLLAYQEGGYRPRRIV